MAGGAHAAEREVTIVIPSWDAAALLEKTLPSTLAQAGVDYEVLVVDNGSPRNDTVELVERLAAKHPGKIRCLRLAHQAGYTGAVNAGVANASTRLVAVLGNDNIAPSDWLASLLREYRAGKFAPTGRTIGAVMSQTIVGGAEPPGACTLNHLGRNIFYRDDLWTKRAFATFYPGGNAFLFDREAFGLPFADFYFAYHEDVSLGWRVRLRGLEVVQSAGPRIASFDGGSTKRKSVRFRSLVLTERNRLLNCLSFPEWHTLLRLFPLLALDALATLAFGKNRRAKLYAWIWIMLHPRTLWRLRRQRQHERVVSDREALGEMSWRYFSTVPESGGLASVAKKIVNVLVVGYMRALFIPGRAHR